MKPTDVYAAVTERILADLRAGTRPWIQSWTAVPTALPLRHGGEPYRGINVLLLWAAAFDRGYASPHWMTYRQAQTLGGQVRRGETSSRVFFVRTVERRADRDPAGAAGDDDPDHVRVHRVYSVFNADQIDGLPDGYRTPPPGPANPGERIAHCESWFANLGFHVAAHPSRACYQPRPDTIRMPPFESFESPEAYYAVLAHESVHATNTPARAHRGGFGEFGSPEYAFEELVAELGSAFVCAELGISAEPRPDHAAYIAGWIKALENDPRTIVRAAALAQKAVDWLRDRQPGHARQVRQPVAEAA